LTRRSPRSRRLPFAFALASILVAGCASAAAPSSSPAPTTAPSAAAGPASFADWTTRQGFGGASGVRLMNENVLFIVNHPSEMTTFFIDEDEGDIAALIGWLDEHPATACWAEYHATVRTGLADLNDAYEKLRPVVEAGSSVPPDVATAMAAQTKALLDLAAPAGCP
jgi:hypothetical protein